MEKTCGFVDMNGIFHKKEKSCRLADNRIKIRNIEHKLNNFSKEIHQVIFHQERIARTSLQYIEKETYEMVCKVILKNTPEFLQVIKEAEDLEDELDSLYNAEEGKWWFTFKWW